MRRSTYYLYKRVLLPVKNFFWYRSVMFYVVLGLFIVFTLTLYYLASFIVELIYESEMQSIVSKNGLILWIFLPIFLALGIITVFFKAVGTIQHPVFSPHVFDEILGSLLYQRGIQVGSILIKPTGISVIEIFNVELQTSIPFLK